MKSNTDSEKAFFKAIAAGDQAQVRSMVAGDVKLLSAFDYDSFGATPLTSVCFSNRRPIVDLLLDLGVDPNRRSDWHMGPWSPLHCALYRHDADLAKHLLERGATLDVHTAAGLGWLDEIEKMLDQDPTRVHERGGDGCYPLHFADTVEVAECLLKRGALIDGRCIDHYSTPVQYLCSWRPAVARYLLERGATADIFSVVAADDKTRLEQMLARDAKLCSARIDQTFFPPSPEHDVHNVLTFTVGHHATPLHAAANLNRPTMVPVLIAHGADVNARGGYDQAAPLHVAAWNDQLEVAAALLDHGADINLRSGPLHKNAPAGWAIVAGSERVFGLLIDRGAEILDWFVDDAEDGCKGRFDAFNCVPHEARQRILAKLK
jgi:ankyrin repeat protein